MEDLAHIARASMWLPPANTAWGVVGYGLITIAIASALRYFRVPLLRFSRRALLSLPKPLRRKAADVGYLVAPSWRSYVPGGSRSPQELQGRIDSLSTGRKPKVCLVGGVYVDLRFGPVDLTPPWDVERSTVEQLEVSVGGSCHFVAEHLWRGFRIKSRLFSIVGQKDEVTTLLKRRIRSLPYLTHTYLKDLPGSRSGVSLHLVSRDGSPLPTFTYPGAVEHLRWGDILRPLQRSFRRGKGVLLIGSLYRAELIRDFAASVSQVAPNVLVIVDPGRTDPANDVDKARTLARHCAAGLADILIITPNELRTFLSASGTHFTNESDGELLRMAANSNALPRVTIVRGQRSFGYPKAAIIIDGHISIEQGDDSRWRPNNSVGGKMSFNAAFIHDLTKRRPNLSLEDRIRSAVRAALIYWSTVD